MSKQLNVNLAFTADTGTARSQLQELQNSLTRLVNTSTKQSTGLGLTKELNDATTAAAELKVHLDQAVNVNTGNLDFSKLSESLKRSGKTLSEYGEQLQKLGPDGQKAFQQLAQSITNAEIPIKRSNAAVQELWTSLKNTARWQMSSSMLHGFMGAIQSAYGYAKNLNESLNEIRIVTEHNIDYMDKFAEKANKAAKALSATTLDYTNASLIYYQQGLSDQEVADRTAVTLKMANVANESATTISEQLTSVWNNFYDGSESLEHYADAMVRLGADTASSSSEISEGLQKFSSVAGTIGLSFENAAAALATITATTRESADVVGTALKTLFSRIQGLNLGQTLEDGTDLNKYSTALHKVGIEIKDTDGQLKDMDVILDEMGSKWNTWGRDTQTALAQTVAGVRQYTQLMTLMNNYDFYKENVERAKNADGSLQEQADIYAESWEAARNRVRTAWEGIYANLVDDKAFIKALNIIEKLLTYFDNLIDTVGGLGGVLTTLGAILTKVFSNQIAQSISNIAYNLKMMTPQGQQQVRTEKQNFIRNAAEVLANDDTTPDTTANSTASEFYIQKLNLQDKMIDKVGQMSELEKQVTQQMMDQLDVQGKQTIETAKALDIAKQKKANAAVQIYANNASNPNIAPGQSAGATSEQLKKVRASTMGLDKARKVIQDIGKDSTNVTNKLEQFATILSSMKENEGIDIISDKDIASLQKLLQELSNGDIKAEDLEETLQSILGLFTHINDSVIESAAQATQSSEKEMRDYANSVVETTNAEQRLKEESDTLQGRIKGVGDALAKAQGKQKIWSDNLVICANSAFSVVSALQMIGGIVNTIEDPDISGWEKFLSIAGTVLMMITTLAPTFQLLSDAIIKAGASAAGATPAVAGFGAAFNAALGPIGWVSLALTALIAVIAVVVANLDTISEKAQKHFDQMSNDAQDAAEKLSEAENAYKNLQETINQYSEIQDNIDTLTKGTEEFKQAVIEANKAARTLIETYGVISHYNAESGLIEINQEDLDKAIANNQQKLENARMNNVAAQSNKTMALNSLSNSKAVEKDNVSFGSRVSKNLTFGAGVGSALTIAGYASGVAALPTAVANLAALIIAMTDAIAQDVQQRQNDKQQSDALEALEKAYITNGGNYDQAYNSLNDTNKSLISSLGMTATQLENLCSEVSTNTAAILQNNKELVNNNFQDNSIYKNSNHKDELNTLLAKNLTDETKRLYDEKYSNDAHQMSDEAAQKDYAEMMGYTWIANKSGNIGVYSKGDGSADFTLSDETARRALAQKEAFDALNGSVEEYNQTLLRVEKTGETFGKGLGNFMIGMAGGASTDLSNATRQNVIDLESNVKKKNATDIISDEDAQNMGYDNAQAYVNSLISAINGYNDKFTAIGNNLSSSINKGFLENSDLTLSGAQSMADNLQKAFNMSGTDTANLLESIFETAGKDAEKLSNVLSTIDWGDPNAIAKLNDLIIDQGINLDTTNANWQYYITLMSQAGKATVKAQTQLENFRKTISDVSSITKDLKTNDIISDDDYKKLLEINPAIKELFMITSEGYRFLGQQKTLDQLLGGTSKESIEGIKTEFANLNKEGAIINKTNWFDDNGNRKFTKDRDIASVANFASDDSSLDASLALMGVSKDSLQEAAQYILDYTNEETGEILKDKTGFSEEKYNSYLQYAQNFYTQLGDIRQNYLDGNYDGEMAEQVIASMTNNLGELQELYNNGAIGLEAYNQQLSVLALNASSLNELDTIRAENIDDFQSYAIGLINLASQYNNCAQEIEKFKIALNNGNKSVVEETEDLLRASIAIGEAAEKYDIDAEAAEIQAKQLAKAYNLNAEAAAKMAINNARMNKGVESLVDNWSDWKKALKATDKTTLDYAKAVKETTAAIADLVGASSDLELPEEFFNDKNYKLIDKAIQGDSKAIDTLGLEVAKAQTKALEFNDAIAQAVASANDGEGLFANFDPTEDLKEQFDAAKTIVTDAMSEIQGYINSGLSTEEINAKIHNMNEDWVTALNDMAMVTGMSVDDMNSILGSMGVQAKVDTKYVEQPMEVPTYTEHYELADYEPPEKDEQNNTIRPASWSQKKYTVPGAPYTVNGYVAVAQISTEANPMEVETSTSKGTVNSGATYTGHGSVSSSATKGSKGGGGSKSKASKKDLTKKSDVVDRYKEIDDSIHDLTRSLDKGNKAADRMWGKSRISAMKANNKMLQDEIGLLNKKAEEAKKYLALDKQELLLAAKKAGVNFQFDEDGDISNYTQEMTRLYDELHAAEEHINSLKTKEAQDEYEESVLKAIEDKIAELKSALSQYEETKSSIEDLEDQAEEKFYEWQDNNFEILNHELEVKITLDDNELKKLDYFFNKLSDNIYKAAEALGYLQGQIDPTFGKMKSYEDYYNSLESSYANGEISQAAYVEGLQDAYDSIIDNLEAVQDLDKQMLEYYGNTLDLAEEELSKYIDQMEHLTSVLDHYRSILSLLGRDTDYTRVLTVLEGNAQTKRNKFDTSKAWYESLKAERDAAAAALAQASDDAERELLQKNYDAIVAKFNEAEEQMLSDAEAYGEAIKEVLTTKMEQAAENMNKAMTDGMGWDALNDSLDRLSKYQDEYLTKTNQIYEMNKLLNDVNKASNKTNNQAAKDKYYQFSKEIEQLKEKDKLSQLELDIAQAKYKVLQAQIALDEAQNAMGKVRLQRDNEGNFGYIYTADQDKIDDAQQALADAENDLYNIRLDATNKYGQQKLQYEQELAEKLKEIDEKANEDALYREGNYQADRQRIIDEYTQLIQASSDLYRIAQEEDSRVVQDAWVNAYDEIIDNGDKWKTAIIDYTGQINNAFQEWQAETDRLTDLVGKDLVDTKNKVNDVTNASDQLKDEVINKVVPTLTQELQAVRNATEAYARQRQEIMTLISYYEQLINKIQQAIAAQASMDAGSNSSSSDYDDYDPSVDYSALMGTVPVGSELYNKYKAYRDRKMSEGSYNNMASTARVNAFYEKGYTLGQGPFAGYSNFTQIPDWLWEQTVGFRTGGYTGQWGDSGKLAMLHEKELVLNKEDTENMLLSSIKMVREIASEIDLRSRYTTMPINPIYSTFGTGNDILEQQVHIDASFPNVTDRNEIQEAFNTLINVASQYANRK